MAYGVNVEGGSGRDRVLYGVDPSCKTIGDVRKIYTVLFGMPKDSHHSVCVVPLRDFDRRIMNVPDSYILQDGDMVEM